MERQALGGYEKDLVEQAERYGILAMEMLRHTKADRLDAALFALEKQNEAFCELLDLEQETEATEGKGEAPATNETDCRPQAIDGWGAPLSLINFYDPAMDSCKPWFGIVIVMTEEQTYLMDVKPQKPPEEREPFWFVSLNTILHQAKKENSGKDLIITILQVVEPSTSTVRVLQYNDNKKTTFGFGLDAQFEEVGELKGLVI